MIVIHPHSIVDLITNSSTELFVIDTDKSIETVKEILQKESIDYFKEIYNEWKDRVEYFCTTSLW